MAAAMTPRKKPVKYWASVNSILMAPKAAVYSPTSYTVPICTTAEMYMPAPKKMMLPSEL